jgi:hypothetical protein
MKLTSKAVGLLVQRALCLEALADKSGCTTRYVDLEGRPLEDFIIAGINVGPLFEQFAVDWQTGNEIRLFHYFVEALKASNQHKSDKFINFGLLEILFPTVAARLSCNNPGAVVSCMVDLMKQAPKSDVGQMVRARELAWTTSGRRRGKLADFTPSVRAAPNPYSLYEAVVAGTPHVSIKQWVEEYQAGLPLLKRQFDSMQQSREPILLRIKQAYEPLRQENPDMRVGILADMSAAAIFLHLSFTEE